MPDLIFLFVLAITEFFIGCEPGIFSAIIKTAFRPPNTRCRKLTLHLSAATGACGQRRGLDSFHLLKTLSAMIACVLGVQRNIFA